jgi:preprotein translocase subunit SecY
MFSAFLNCWKIPELRKRILFTLGMVALARVGAAIPCPGVDPTALNAYINRVQSQVGGSFVGLAMLLTGGGLQRCAVFALGIMPYITAAIIMQLITAVVPSLARLQQEGESGRAKLIQYGRYLTVLICVVQGFFLAKAFENPAGTLFPGFTGVLVQNPGIGFELLTVITITSGSILLMWFGEQITERGIGNGASIIITVGIVDRLPSAVAQAWATLFASETAVQFRILQAILLLVMAVVGVAAVVAVTEAQRKIPVQYAKQIVGRKMRGGQQVFMPLKVNYAGVMPIIFAQAILLFPQKIFGMSHIAALQKLARSLTEGEFLYLTLYGLMILFFSYFWVATQFNPLQIADDLKKYGGYVPGIRPGKPTAEYLDHTMTRITLAGAVFLTVIAVIPYLLSHHFQLPYLTASFFGGTSLLITVGVMLDTMRQVESHLLMRHYDGFLRKGKLRGGRR